MKHPLFTRLTIAVLFLAALIVPSTPAMAQSISHSTYSIYVGSGGNNAYSSQFSISFSKTGELSTYTTVDVNIPVGVIVPGSSCDGSADCQLHNWFSYSDQTGSGLTSFSYTAKAAPGIYRILVRFTEGAYSESQVVEFEVLEPSVDFKVLEAGYTIANDTLTVIVPMNSPDLNLHLGFKYNGPLNMWYNTSAINNAWLIGLEGSGGMIAREITIYQYVTIHSKDLKPGIYTADWQVIPNCVAYTLCDSKTTSLDLPPVKALKIQIVVIAPYNLYLPNIVH